MRLHIGASRIQLATPEMSALRSQEWVHLGEPEPIEAHSPHAVSGIPQDGYLSFYYSKGNLLPFDDSAFTFGFSEHFFEHLFLDEACELLKECFRVLQPHACFRVVVPDADLRTYLDPEPAGYSTGDHRWFHPDKHKSRWSIYSLGYVLEQTGFVTQGVVYCDKFGSYHVNHPKLTDVFYQDCLDGQIVGDTSYISRFHNSLIIDAKKPLR